MTDAPSEIPAVEQQPAQPVTPYDVVSYFLWSFQGQEPQQLQSLAIQLGQNYGKDVVIQAAQNMFFTVEATRWKSYAAIAAVQGQQMPSPPLQNPFPPPNFDGAAKLVANWKEVKLEGAQVSSPASQT